MGAEKAKAHLAAPAAPARSEAATRPTTAAPANPGWQAWALSQPGDASEVHAERSAAAWAAGQARAPAWAGGPVNRVQRKCAACEQEERVQQAQAGEAASPAVGSGQALPGALRQPMERFFARGLGDVSLHTGGTAAASARQLGARAFTQGSRVAFAAGEYAPDSKLGQALLAHELAHVAQGGAQLRRQVTDSADAGVSTMDDADADAGAVGTEPGAVDITGAPSDASPLGGMEAVPPTGPDAIAWFGDLLSSDPAFMHHQLRLRMAREPVLHEAAGVVSAWLDEFSATIDRTGYAWADESGVSASHAAQGVWLERARRVLPVARGELLSIEVEQIRFEREFLARGELAIAGMLDMSRERVESEALRYGLSRSSHTTTRMVHDGLARSRETHISHTYSMSDSAGSRGLATAAGALAAGAQTVVNRARAHWDSYERVRGFDGPEYECGAACASAARALQEARGNYDRLRDEKEREYPILAAYAALPREDALWPLEAVVARLSTLSRGATAGNAETLFDEIDEKRRNIERTFEALTEGDLVLWELAPALAVTQDEMGVTEGSWQQRWVRETAHEHNEANSLRELALGALALGLGLVAAIPTGGASLAVAATVTAAGLGAAGLGTYMAVDHARQYLLDSAASGTDFDRARAVSSADPSLFWLAVDIIGAGLDIGGAVHAFSALSGTVRTALRAERASAEAEAAIAAAVERAEALHPGLGDLVGQSLRREAAREGGSVERAIREWESGFLNAESRAFLIDNPGTRTLYSGMTSRVREALTFCASVCVLPRATPGQAQELEALLLRWRDGDMTRLRQYLHANADNLDGALARLRDAPDWRAVDHAILEEARGASFAPADNPFAGLTEAEIDDALDEMFSPSVTGGARPTIDGHRVPTRARRRIDIQGIARAAGETARAALARVRRIIGVRLDEIPAVRRCWEEARAGVLARSELSASNYAELYDRTRRAFWRNVLADPEALGHFERAGFHFPGADGSAPLLRTGADVSATEIRVSLDHILEKAIGDNWRFALDADNLRMEFAMPNTYREIVQARHPELR